MYTAKSIRFSVIFRFAWKSLLIFIAYSLLICIVDYYTAFDLNLSFVPVGMIGTAVALYVGFKNNSSYERLWEGRRIWGSLTNASRSWAVAVLDYIQSDKTELVHKELIYRHLAYLNTIRWQLRRSKVWEHDDSTSEAIVLETHAFDKHTLPEEIKDFLPETEIKKYLSKQNPATHILRKQSERLTELHRNGMIQEFPYVELMRLIQEFYNQQGACERLKSFPFPRQYAYFSKVFVWILILVLPFSLINEFGKLGKDYIWLTIPFHVIISWIFHTMEKVGDTSENPFENGLNDIPMTAICRNIEIDLKELLNENQIPAKIKPVDNILM